MSKNTNPVNQYSLRLSLTGFFMGVADLVPGVSGGTVAFLTGIYDELLFSIKVASGKAPKLLLKGKIKEAFKSIPFSFLLPLAIGMLTAIFSLAKVVRFLLDNQAVYVWSLFFGLVLSSVYVVSKRVPKWNLARIVLALFSFVATFLILGLPVLDIEATPLILFFTGAIAITAMILPGISGSLIMVILGQYKNVVNAVADRNLIDLITFAIGAILGLALFSRLLSWLLKNHHAAVIATMIGIMLGSLRRVWPWQTELADKTYENNLPNLSWSLIGSVTLMASGFTIVWLLEKRGIAKERDDIDDPEFIEEVKQQHD